MEFAKDVLRKSTPKVFALLKGFNLLTHPNSYLKSIGLLKTYEKGYPCKADGSPLPWMNYNIIKFLEDRLKKDLKLFEYGSGYSTLFYSNLVGSVVSIEHNKQWYEKVKKQIGNNVKLIYHEYHENGDYPKLVTQQNETYDVIVVDAVDRVKCAINAIDALSDRGVILIDDTMRENYSKAFKFLQEKGFKRLDFEGIKPNEITLAKTSIFYRSNNCLDL